MTRSSSATWKSEKPRSLRRLVWASVARPLLMSHWGLSGRGMVTMRIRAGRAHWIASGIMYWRLSESFWVASTVTVEMTPATMDRMLMDVTLRPRIEGGTTSER